MFLFIIIIIYFFVCKFLKIVMGSDKTTHKAFIIRKTLFKLGLYYLGYLKKTVNLPPKPVGFRLTFIQ